MYRLTMNFVCHVGTVLVLSFFVVSQASLNATTGLCNLYTFVPFTDNGADAKSFSGSARVIPGFVHMAAALMAMEHFNLRNTSVVPELKDFDDCRYKFDIDNSLMFDSGTVTHLASRSLFKAGEAPCAIAGPFHDLPGSDLSVMAQAAEIPIVMHGSFDLFSLSAQRSPFTSQVYPDASLLAAFTADFLRNEGRTDYISILYPMSGGGLQWKDTLMFVFQAFDMQTFSAPVLDPQQEDLPVSSAPSALDNLKKLKQRGFRTIVVPLEDPLFNVPLIADAAEELGMNNGDYFWVWLCDFSASHLYLDNPNITKLVYGSAFVLALEKTNLDEDGSNPFIRAFTSQGADFAERVNNMNPIPRGEPGYAFAPPDFFTSGNFHLEYGVAFMYDAVMSVGIGACKAENSSGVSHLNGIRKAEFSGASGTVRFRGSGSFPGAREDSTASFGVLNFLPVPGSGGGGTPWVLTDAYAPEWGGWQQLQNFTFADGRVVPPDFLRDPPPQNYLPNGLRILGFVLLGIVLASAIATCAWVYWTREHQVLRAAQPTFLYVLSFGASIFSSAIIPLSFDESYGWNEAQLSAGCTSFMWLIAIGHIITYSALFCKLWRVNKVLQFTRRKVEIRHVAWPAGILVVAALVILGLWTGLDPLVWTRVEIEPYTGESIGFCQCNNPWVFVGPLIVVMLIPTVMTGVMAWKTKDVDESYSESRWIFALIFVQIELLCIGVPVIAVLRTVSTPGKYMGLVLILWLFPMSTLVLVMLPKVFAYVKAIRGIESGPTRGSRAGCKISGLQADSSALNQQHSQLRGVSNVESICVNESESLARTTIRQEELVDHEEPRQSLDSEHGDVAKQPHVEQDDRN